MKNFILSTFPVATYSIICFILKEDVLKKTGPAPPCFEFQHIPIVVIYRVYYRNLEIDPQIFPATPPRVAEVPSKRPEDVCIYALENWSPMKGANMASEERYIQVDNKGPRHGLRWRMCHFSEAP